MNLAQGVKLLNFIVLYLASDEVVRKSLRDYEEQLVWIFTG